MRGHNILRVTTLLHLLLHLTFTVLSADIKVPLVEACHPLLPNP
jgi:hypothetical protein